MFDNSIIHEQTYHPHALLQCSLSDKGDTRRDRHREEVIKAVEIVSQQ